jgi:hypothetical protein
VNALHAYAVALERFMAKPTPARLAVLRLAMAALK